MQTQLAQVTEHPDKSSLLVGVTQNLMLLRLTRNPLSCPYVPSTNTFTVSNIVGDLTGDVTGTATTALANTSTIVNWCYNLQFRQLHILMVEQEHKLKSDTSLCYTPTSQTLTTGTVVAALTGDVTGNVSGNLTGNVTGDVTGTPDTCNNSSSTNIQIDSGATDANRLIMSFDGTGSSQRQRLTLT